MPLVPCSKCATTISDVAETCPRCGHPQPIKTLSQGEKGGTCTSCGTFNILYFGQGVKCRGCARPLDEVFEKEHKRSCAEHAYRDANEFIGYIVPLSFGVTLAAAGILLKPSAITPVHFLPALLGLFVVWNVTAGVVRAVVRSSRGITQEAWNDGAVDFLKAHPKFSDQWPGLKGWLIGMAVLFGLSCLFQAVNLYDQNHQKERKEKEAGNTFLARVRSHIAVKVQTGAFSSDLLLTNEDGVRFPFKDLGLGLDACALSRCDLTITICFDSGVKLPLTRHWERWGIGETKTVNFNPQGKVERVELKGVVFDAEGKGKGNLEMSFTIGPEK